MKQATAAAARPELHERQTRALKIVKPTEKPRRNDQSWKGLYRHGAGWLAVVSQGRNKPQVKKQFPFDTDARVMQDWREDTIASLRVTRKRRATQGAFSLDAKKYLDLEAVKEMPSFEQRKRHIEFWVEKFGDRQRSDIETNEIENAYRRMMKEPRQPPRNGTRPTTRPIAVDTANKYLRALSNMYWLLDRKRDNPVRLIKEMKGPKIVAGGGRSIPYDKIEAIIAALHDVGPSVKGSPRVNFSETKIRVRCMAYCQITEGALMALAPGHINFEDRTVLLAARKKAKGADPIWTPVTTKALAAFRDFHERNLYGTFARSAALRVFKRAARDAGLTRAPRLHDLRHSVATALKRVTTDGEAVDYLLQHTIQGTTFNYIVDSVPQRVTDAVAALDAHQLQF